MDRAWSAKQKLVSNCGLGNHLLHNGFALSRPCSLGRVRAFVAGQSRNSEGLKAYAGRDRESERDQVVFKCILHTLRFSEVVSRSDRQHEVVASTSNIVVIRLQVLAGELPLFVHLILHTIHHPFSTLDCGCCLLLTI